MITQTDGGSLFVFPYKRTGLFPTPLANTRAHCLFRLANTRDYPPLQIHGLIVCFPSQTHGPIFVSPCSLEGLKELMRRFHVFVSENLTEYLHPISNQKIWLRMLNNIRRSDHGYKHTETEAIGCFITRHRPLFHSHCTLSRVRANPNCNS